MKKSDNVEALPEYVNTADRLSREARLKGMLGHFDPRDGCGDDGVPEVHVTVDHGCPCEHDPHQTCWCDPYLEFKTPFVAVWRHRRMQ